MNFLQKIALKGKLKQLLPKSEEIESGKITIDYLLKIVSFHAKSKSGISENISDKIEDYTDFQEILTAGLNKHLKYDELHKIVMNLDFIASNSFTEVFFIYQGKKQFFQTQKK